MYMIIDFVGWCFAERSTRMSVCMHQALSLKNLDVWFLCYLHSTTYKYLFSFIMFALVSVLLILDRIFSFSLSFPFQLQLPPPPSPSPTPNPLNSHSSSPHSLHLSRSRLRRVTSISILISWIKLSALT